MKIWVFFYFDRAIARTANEPPGSRAVVHCSSPKSFDPQTPLTYSTHPSKGNSASAFPAPSHHPPKGNSASAFPAPSHHPPKGNSAQRLPRPSHHPPKRTAPAPSRPSAPKSPFCTIATSPAYCYTQLTGATITVGG